MGVRDLDFRQIPFNIIKGIPREYVAPAIFLKNNFEEGFPKIIWTEHNEPDSGGVFTSRSTNSIFGDTSKPMQVAKYILDLVRYEMVTNELTGRDLFSNPLRLYYSDEYEPVARLLYENMKTKGLSVKKDLYVLNVDNPFYYISPPELDYSLSKSDFKAKLHKRNDVRKVLLYLGQEYGERFFQPPFGAFDYEDNLSFAVNFGITSVAIDEIIEKRSIVGGNLNEIVNEFDKILWSQHPIIPLIRTCRNRLKEPINVLVSRESEKNSMFLNELEKIGYDIISVEMPEMKKVHKYINNHPFHKHDF